MMVANRLNIFNLFLWLFIITSPILFNSIANAQVYKCNINGKTIYSDAMCAYKADTFYINPMQNIIPKEPSHKKLIDESKLEKKENDSKCEQLLDEIQYNRPNQEDSLGNLLIKRSKRQAIKEEFNMRCNAYRSNQ